MLAEKRKKQKWSLNPRGTLWSSDSNKFGQRLLEKMGWKSGCGLGVNLQGPTEHVRVSVKNDSKGVGFKGRAEDVLEHQASFSKLLEELNGGVKEDVKVISLEQQSQQSRARLHYRKFTRGKDLSRCSDKDLQCILGKNISNNEEVDEHSFAEQERDLSFGVVTVNGGNCDAYFENKLGNKSGFEAKEECVYEDNLQSGVMQNSKKKKCKKSKNLKDVAKTEESEQFLNDLVIEEVSATFTDTWVSTNKTKDRKRKLKTRLKEFVTQLEQDHEENGEDCAISIHEKNKNESEDHAIGTLVVVGDSKELSQKKKNKLDRRKNKKSKVPETELNKSELQSVTMKKKRKRHLTQVYDAAPLKNCEENSDNETRTAVSETCNDNLKVNGSAVSSEQGTDCVYKKKSKKKKRKTSNNELVEEMLQERVTIGIVKGPAATDLGFKGSNIMCIKGYGVT